MFKLLPLLNVHLDGWVEENLFKLSLGLQIGVPVQGFPDYWFAPGTPPHLHVPGGTGSGKVPVVCVFKVHSAGQRGGT